MTVQIPSPRELYKQARTTPWTEADAQAVWRVFYGSASEQEALTDDDIDRGLIAAVRQYMRLGRMEASFWQAGGIYIPLVARWRKAGYPVWSIAERSLLSRLIRFQFLDGVFFDLDPPRFL